MPLQTPMFSILHTIIVKPRRQSKILRKRSIVQIKKLLILSKYKQAHAIMIMLLLVMPNIAHAGSLNAGTVLNDMDKKQRYAYVSGVVEGLAYSRFLAGKSNEEGMTCIYDWYYEGDATEQWTRITAWLKRHPDKPVGVLMHILIKKDCGQ